MRKFGLGFAMSAVLSISACSSSGPGAGGESNNDAAGQMGGAAGTGTGCASGEGGNAGMPGSGGASGQSGSGGNAPDAGGGDGAPASTWPQVTAFYAPGSFPIQRENNVGPDAAYDIFRPAQLGAQWRKHPIVSWNNGPYPINQYQDLLNHWASHGFVVMGGA